MAEIGQEDYMAVCCMCFLYVYKRTYDTGFIPRVEKLNKTSPGYKEMAKYTIRGRNIMEWSERTSEITSNKRSMKQDILRRLYAQFK